MWPAVILPSVWAFLTLFYKLSRWHLSAAVSDTVREQPSKTQSYQSKRKVRSVCVQSPLWLFALHHWGGFGSVASTWCWSYRRAERKAGSQWANQWKVRLHPLHDSFFVCQMKPSDLLLPLRFYVLFHKDSFCVELCQAGVSYFCWDVTISLHT